MLCVAALAAQLRTSQLVLRRCSLSLRSPSLHGFRRSCGHLTNLVGRSGPPHFAFADFRIPKPNAAFAALTLSHSLTSVYLSRFFRGADALEDHTIASQISDLLFISWVNPLHHVYHADTFIAQPTTSLEAPALSKNCSPAGRFPQASYTYGGSINQSTVHTR